MTFRDLTCVLLLLGINNCRPPFHFHDDDDNCRHFHDDDDASNKEAAQTTTPTVQYHSLLIISSHERDLLPGTRGFFVSHT